MKQLLRNTASSIMKRSRRHSVLRKLSDMEQKGGDSAPIAGAFRDAILRNLNEEEAAAIAKIEAIRESLLKDTSEIKYMDFGAGSAKNARSTSEAKAGVKDKRNICDVTHASKSYDRCLLLFMLIRNLKPTASFEMGSCVGISGSYISTAMQLNGFGTFRTMEGSAEVAKIAATTLSELNLNGEVVVGSFQESLVTHMEGMNPIDFLFNDGHHDGEAVIEYYNKSLPHLAEKSIIVFDDINWSSSMKNSFNMIKARKDTRLSIDFRWGGLVIREVGAKVSDHYKLWM